MSYQILSRKYRPQRFDELFGQEHVVQLLGNAVRSGRIGQAYLFVGPRGVGKTTTARILARALNCEQRVPSEREADSESTRAASDARGAESAPASFEPCGTCDSCRDIAAGSDLDVVEMDAASNNHVDDVRTLREQVGYATVRSRYRIWIVDEVHMLSVAAFNAFLKTLEEPPAGVKFFFCTTELHKLPETIRSRCIKVELRPVRPDAIVARLRWLIEQEDLEVEDALPAAIASAAQGGLRDAEALLEQLLAACPDGTLRVADLDRLCGRASQAHVDALLHAIDDRDPAGALDAVDASLASGAKPGVLIDQWLHRFRDEMIAGAREEAPRVAGSARAIDLLLTKRAHVRAGADGGLVAQVAAIELARLPDARDVDALLDSVRDASGRAASPGGAADTRHTRAPRSSEGGGSGGGDVTDGGTPPRPEDVASPHVAPTRVSRTHVAPRQVAPKEAASSRIEAPRPSGASRVAEAAPRTSRTPARSTRPSQAPTPTPKPDSTPPSPRPDPAPVRTTRVVERTGLDAPRMQARWDELVEDVQRRDPQVAQLLARTDVVEIRGDQVVLSVEDRTHHARTTLMRGEVKLLFGQATRRVFGVLFCPVLAAGSHRENEPQPMDLRMRDHPVVQRVAEASGGRLVTVHPLTRSEHGTEESNHAPESSGTRPVAGADQ